MQAQHYKELSELLCRHKREKDELELRQSREFAALLQRHTNEKSPLVIQTTPNVTNVQPSTSTGGVKRHTQEGPSHRSKRKRHEENKENVAPAFVDSSRSSPSKPVCTPMSSIEPNEDIKMKLKDKLLKKATRLVKTNQTEVALVDLTHDRGEEAQFEIKATEPTAPCETSLDLDLNLCFDNSFASFESSFTAAQTVGGIGSLSTEHAAGTLVVAEPAIELPIELLMYLNEPRDELPFEQPILDAIEPQATQAFEAFIEPPDELSTGSLTVPVDERPIEQVVEPQIDFLTNEQLLGQQTIRSDTDAINWTLDLGADDLGLLELPLFDDLLFQLNESD